MSGHVYNISKSSFYNSNEYDFASYNSSHSNFATINNSELKLFIQKTGLHDIANIVQKELADKGLLESLFIEFNLIGTLLDTKSPNNLESLTYIRQQNNNTFAKNIINNSNDIIKRLYHTQGYTIFYHPDTFIDQDKPKIPYSIIEKDSTIVEEIIDDNNEEYTFKELIITNPWDSNTEKWIGGQDKIVVGNSQFIRDYNGIIETANTIKVSITQAIDDFHKEYHKTISPCSKTVYLAIPILGCYSSNAPINGKENDIQGQGVIFLYFTVPDSYSNDIQSDIEDLAEKLFERLGSFIRLLTYNYLFNLGLNLAENAKIQAIKSAKAAIMSRNMSHNLGSHVMAYLKQKLSSVTTILDAENKVLTDLLPNHIDVTKVQNVELPFLVGLGRFIGYLQERQDYIATISTDYIPYGAPVNLKDAIYDELNPDLRFLRHKVNPNDPAGSADDASNRPANILLNYIAKSENLSRENMSENFTSNKDIRFGFIKYTPAANEIGYSTDTFGFSSFDSTNLVLTDVRKITFSLPGGLVGRQAFFSIVENLIRNAAKHGNTSEVPNLDFTIDVINGSDIVGQKECTAWKQRIADPKWRELYQKASDIEDLFIVTITDNLKTSPGVVKDLQKGLYEDFVDTITGKMTTANKGIKEMRISAAWLRSETNEEKYLKYEEYGNNRGNKAPLVAVELSPEGNLRYIFCIRKDKTVAIIPEVVINKGTQKERRVQMGAESRSLFAQLQLFNKDCWNIVGWEDFLQSKSSYSFILIPDDQEVYNALRPLTSNRILRWEEKTENISALSTANTALIKVYQNFTGLNHNSEKIFISDGRAKAENERRNEAAFKNIRFDAENINYGHDDVFLYTTHLSNEKDYKRFANSDDYGKQKCAEGITGDNSSDRLVRREPLDEKWYYNHLYSMKKHIAIIDERIFKLAHNIDENKFFSYDELSVENLQKMVDSRAVTEKEVLDRLQNNYKELKLNENDQMELMSADSLDDIKDLDIIAPNSLFKGLLIHKKNQMVKGISHLTSYYHGKNIDIFTVVHGEDNKMMLVGCLDSSFDGDHFNNIFGAIATFEKNGNNGFVLKPVQYNEQDKANKKKNATIMNFFDQFDYISIHQGILDKIYENLKIKNNNESKAELTACIHRALMKDKTVIGDYLPRFIIHSGRAKPTKEDMPQKQPFVQYAAIENAVKDCKIMLVELLDYAKYEE